MKILSALLRIFADRNIWRAMLLPRPKYVRRPTRWVVTEDGGKTWKPGEEDRAEWRGYGQTDETKQESL